VTHIRPSDECTDLSECFVCCLHQWLYQYKIQKTVPSTVMLWRCFRTVLINQFLLLLPISIFALYEVYTWRGCQMSVETLPSMSDEGIGGSREAE
jgi:hypothetical protein